MSAADQDRAFVQSEVLRAQGERIAALEATVQQLVGSVLFHDEALLVCAKAIHGDPEALEMLAEVPALPQEPEPVEEAPAPE